MAKKIVYIWDMKSGNFFSKRIGAFVIDMILVGFLSSLINNFIQIKYEIASFYLFDTEFYFGYSLTFIIFFLYFLYFDLKNNGITLGKKAVDIMVIGKETKLDLKKRIYRSALKVVSILLLPVTMVIFLFNKSTLQDKLLKTKTISV